MNKQKLKLYYVEGGDTLYKIAKRFNTSEQEIMKYNMPWLSGIAAGIKLWVPDNRIGTEISSIVDDITNADKISGSEANMRAKASDIESVEISPEKIIYKKDASPGYVVIKLRTKVPTIGSINISGHSYSEKIALPETTFKTEHLILWAPMCSQTKQPLLPGEYTLSFNLYKKIIKNEAI